MGAVETGKALLKKWVFEGSKNRFFKESEATGAERSSSDRFCRRGPFLCRKVVENDPFLTGPGRARPGSLLFYLGKNVTFSERD